MTTDYDVPAKFGTGYVVELPGGGVARCNPALDLNERACDALRGRSRQLTPGSAVRQVRRQESPVRTTVPARSRRSRCCSMLRRSIQSAPAT